MLLSEAVWLGSCGEATAPSDFVVLVQLSDVSPAVFGTDATGQPTISCDFLFSAQATGAGRAEWMDASVSFYVGVDRTQAVSSASIPADQIRQAWGRGDIGAGDFQQMGWQFSAHVPFGGKVDYHYQPPHGPIGTASTTFHCGPDTLASAPPEITSFAVITSSPPQPGDSLQLAFATSSAYGLWTTSLRVDGACTAQRVFVDSLKAYQGGPLTLALPATCPLGAQLTATVTVVDGLLRGTVRTIDLPPLVDLTPPVVTAQMYPRGSGYPSPVLANDLFTGDTLRVQVSVTDNQQLRTLVWEIQPAGYVDSSSVSGLAAQQMIVVPIRPEWAGPAQLRLYARDASGNTSSVLQSAAGAISVYPTLGPPPTAGTVPGAVDNAWFDAAKGVVYLLQGDSARIAVYDPATAAVTGTIVLPGAAADLDLSPTGDSLVVLLQGSGNLVVVDLGTAPPTITVVPIVRGDTILQAGAGRVRVAANGQALVVNDYGYVLYGVTLATRATRVWTLPSLFGQAFPGWLERSLDHEAVVLSWVDYNGAGWVQRYDAATDAWSDASPQDVVFLPAVDGTGAYTTVLANLYDRSLTLLRSVRPWPWLAAGVTALSPDGQTWDTYDGTAGIVQVRTSDAHPLDRILTPFEATLLRATPDGRYLLAVRNGSPTSQVAVIDLTRLSPTPVRRR